MNLSYNAETNWVATLDSSERGRFLALVIHGLTIGQRVLCSVGNVEGFRQLNEATHQVAGLLVDHLGGRKREGIQLYLFELADEQAAVQAIQAWSYAKSDINS